MVRGQNNASVPKIIQHQRKGVTVSIDEYGLVWVLLPRIGHKMRDHGVIVLINQRPSRFEELSANIELDRLGVGRFCHCFKKQYVNKCMKESQQIVLTRQL